MVSQPVLPVLSCVSDLQKGNTITSSPTANHVKPKDTYAMSKIPCRKDKGTEKELLG